MVSQRVEIPGCEIDAEIGAGSIGVVYRGRWGDRPVAIKVIRIGLDPRASAATRVRFRREAACLARLDHPGVVKLVEAGEADGAAFIVMDLVEGDDLAKCLAREGPLPMSSLVRHARELSDALAEVHRRGLVHRDVKPANIIRGADGRLRLIDFGLVMDVAADKRADSVAGTLLYASPEQLGVLHQPVDARSDLYGLGAVLFHCATGAPPFQAPDAADLLRMHATATPPAAHTLRREIGPALSAILSRLLAKDPDDRYQDAETLAADLADLPALDARVAEGGPLVLRADAARADAAAFEIPFIGRDAEQDVLVGAWRSAAAGRGRAVLVAGEPGSGKSRLLRELTRRAPLRRDRTLFGKCSESIRIPFGPIRDAIDAHLVEVLKLDSVARVAAFERVRAAAGERVNHVSQLSRTAALILKDVASPSDATLAPNLDQFSEAIAQFVIGLARHAGGMLFVVDDVQWLDEASRGVLVRLVEQLASVPLLLAMTARSDPASVPAVRALRQAFGVRAPDAIELDPLEADAASVLVGVHLGGPLLSRSVVDLIVTRANGNPFAIGEYVRTLVDDGVVRPRAGQWVVDEVVLSTASLPAEVVDVVVGRLQKLTPGAARVLRAAAVAAGGLRFRWRLLADATGEAPGAIAVALDECLRAHLIERVDEERFSFVHDRVREALERELGADEVRELHQRLAERMDRMEDRSPDVVFQLAQHYSRGHVDRAPARLLAACLAATRLALDAREHEEAHELASHAMDAAVRLGVTGTALAEVNEVLGQTHIRLARIAEAQRCFARALAATSDTLVQMRLHLHLATAASELYSADGVATAARAALAVGGIGAMAPATDVAGWWEAAGSSAPAVELAPRELALLKMSANAYTMWGFMAMIHGDSATVGEIVPKLREVMARLGARTEALPFLSIFAVLLSSLHRNAESARVSERAITMAQQIGDRALEASAKHFTMIASIIEGQLSNVRRLAHEIVNHFARWLPHRQFSIAFSALGIEVCLNGVGAPDVMKALYRGVTEVSDPSGIPASMVTSRAVLAACGALLGEFVESRRHLAEARRIWSTQIPDDFWIHLWVVNWHAFVLLESDELDPALDQLTDEVVAFGRRPEQFPIAGQYVFLFVGYMRGRLAERAGRGLGSPHGEQFRRAVHDVAAVAAQHADRPAHLAILEAAVLRMGGDLAGAATKLDRASDLCSRLDGASSHWVQFELGCERARLARDRGDAGSMAAHAARALALASENQWRPRARRVTQEFGVTGSRTELGAPSRAVSVDALSSTRFLDALLEVSLASASDFDVVEQSRAVLDSIVKVFGAERAFIFSAVEGAEPVLQIGRDQHRADLRTATGYSSTAVREVLHTRRPVVVTGTEEGLLLGSESAVAHELRSIMAAPLKLREKLLGVVYLDSRVAKGLFTRDDLAVFQALANHIAIGAEMASMARLQVAQKQLEHDLELTATVQSFFFPRIARYRRTGLELRGHYQPAGKCGGDWWWYETLSDASVLVLLGDVTGHGTASAMVTAAVAASFRSLRKSPRFDVPMLFSELHADILAMTAETFMMTFMALHLDRARRRATLWTAGAPPALMVDASGHAHAIVRASSPLGSGGGLTMGTVEFDLDGTSRWLLCTDGLFELKRVGGRPLGVRAVARLVEETARLSIDDTAARIRQEVERVRASRELDDDLTFVVIDADTHA